MRSRCEVDASTFSYNFFYMIIEKKGCIMKADEEKELLRCKLEYIIKNYTDGAEDVKKIIGIRSVGTINNFISKKPKSATISQLYMESLERKFNIPLKIWENNISCTEKILKHEIDKYRANLKVKKEQKEKERELFEKLKRQLPILEKRNQELEKLLKASTQENMTLKEKNKKLQDEIVSLKKQLETLMMENKELKEHIKHNSLDFDNDLFKENNRLYSNLLGEWNTFLYSKYQTKINHQKCYNAKYEIYNKIR